MDFFVHFLAFSSLTFMPSGPIGCLLIGWFYSYWRWRPLKHFVALCQIDHNCWPASSRNVFLPHYSFARSGTVTSLFYGTHRFVQKPSDFDASPIWGLRYKFSISHRFYGMFLQADRFCLFHEQSGWFPTTTAPTIYCFFSRWVRNLASRDGSIIFSSGARSRKNLNDMS